MINNFDKVEDLIEFKEGEFYFVQVIKRRKDNSEIKGDNLMLKSFYIENKKYWDAKRSVIIDLCQEHNARAYIRLSRRNIMEVNKDMMRIVLNNFNRTNYKAFDKAAGKSKGTTPHWVIDIDDPNPLLKKNNLVDYMNNVLRDVHPIAEDKIIACLPSNSGLHLISKPFNKSLWPFSNIDVLTNSPTNLFIS